VVLVVLVGHTEYQDQVDLVVHRVIKDLLDQVVLVVHTEYQDQVGQVEHLVQVAQREIQEILEQIVAFLGHLDQVAQAAVKVVLDQVVHLVLKDFRDLKEI
jgi:hypothetical protein